MKQIQPKGNLSPFRIAAIYAIAGVLWILFSDRMLFHFIEDPHTLTRFQTYKGWLFIIVTALLLYWLINRYASEMKHSEEELIKYKEHLEELVQERTAELKESQTALMNMVDDLNKKTGELKIANERLKEVDRLKSIFIASMSHELRTPLNSIIGFSSILLNEWLGPLNQEQKENLASILRSGKHLLALINDTIDVSKIEAGTIEMHEEDFDVYDVIAEAVDSLSEDVKDKGLELKFESIHQQMLTDRRRLLQCMLNLLDNAMKFTEKGSVNVQVRLGSSTDDQGEKGSSLLLVANNSTHNADFVEISVEDTGIGIKEDDIPKLFTAFTHLESHLKWYTPGTGLGLYLTKKLIVEALKGDIMVESTYGKGSKFTLRIPLSAERRIQRKFL